MMSAMTIQTLAAGLFAGLSLLGLGVPPVRTERESTRALATETLRLTGETG